MEKTVTLFGNESCNFCKDAKKWLTDKKVIFTMKDTKLENHMSEFKGYHSPGIPLLIIKDEETGKEKKVIGFSSEKYEKEIS